MGAALEAIERAVASVTDPDDDDQRTAALRSVSPSLVDDVVFGAAAGELGATADGELVAIGIGASPGVGVGVVCRDLDAVLAAADAGLEPALVVDETGPGDEVALRLSVAVVTRLGSSSSHAAIVARHLGLPAVCGAEVSALRAGEIVLVDGATGEVRRMGAAVVSSRARTPITELDAPMEQLLAWADRVAGRARVLANADRPDEVVVARRLGATGVGLARLDRLLVGHPVAAACRAGHRDAVSTLAELVHDHVAGLADAMGGGPLRVRLLDAAVDGDPALGLRGVRIGIVHEELTRAQIRGLATAADRSPDAHIEATVPLVSDPTELSVLRAICADEAADTDLAIGVMIETPRACLVAPALARLSSHFSFGTNDLTQLTYGLSRDLADHSLGAIYRRRGVWERSPFETLDPKGVARLLALAVESGRGANASLVCSLCGEHAADPASIAIAAQLGIDELSVSPYRVPATRLAAAHAVLGTN